MSDEDKKVETDKESFKSLLQAHKIDIPKVGDFVKCKVISVDRGNVKLDIEGLTVGVVRGRELFSESQEYANLKAGDEVEAVVLDLENENNEMELSFRLAGSQKVWTNLQKWMKDGMTIKAKVIDANEQEEKIIVSERAVWEDAQKAVLESYKIGDIVDGEVSALTSFGAFLKFGEGLEGLVHISEIAWQRIEHPRDLLKVGDHVKAQIIQLDKSKIYLSLKRLVDDPWKQVAEKYKVGDKVKGKIIKIEAFGLMVALDQNIHGLAHVSELSDAPLANVADKFKINQEVEFEIVNIEAIEHRLGLRVAGVKGKAPKAPKAKKGEKSEKAEETPEAKAETKSELEEKKAE